MRLKKGIYKHYKGKRYEVLGIAKHSETLEDMAVYQALYRGWAIWVRPLTMFKGKVKINGKLVPRFKYVGQKK
jgi:cyclomaltodextrinase